MSLPIAGFGNVTAADAVRLAAALQTAAAGTPGATVRIAGGTALEFTDDHNVWARLEGEVDALKSMARDVTQVVEQHGFFVDRRRFRPLLRVATVTAATTGPFLETVVAALDDFSGEPWAVDQVWLLKAFYGGNATECEVVDQFPLAPAAVHLLTSSHGDPSAVVSLGPRPLTRRRPRFHEGPQGASMSITSTVPSPSTSLRRRTTSGASSFIWVAQAVESVRTTSRPSAYDSGVTCWPTSLPTITSPSTREHTVHPQLGLPALLADEPAEGVVHRLRVAVVGVRPAGASIASGPPSDGRQPSCRWCR